MSYLAALRLQFSGRFQAAVSTVNNDVAHFDNATFQERFREQGPGGWNPRGNADWRLIGCAVTAASYADGTPAGEDDAVLRMLVADSDRQAPAKLVDLDPEQQLVSTIWGLEVRICDTQGDTLVRGSFVPTGFIDLWGRARSAGTGTDFAMCAAYQSVLTNLEWGDVGASRLLTELRAAATDGLLSIRFNVDGFNHTPGTAGFTLGRIVGAIGVASASEPRHFVAGRQFMAASQDTPLNYCTAVVDEANGRVLLDLGNALPTTTPGGSQASIGTLTLGYAAPGGSTTPLGTIDYLADGWYSSRAGISEVPVNADQLAAIADTQLALTVPGAPPMLESPGGIYVRADAFVFRLAPGEAVDVELFATRFGLPYAGAQITAAEDASGLQGGQGDPTPGDPPSALSFDGTLAPAGADGTATLRITASDPGNPRDYIDGQVYGVRPALADEPASYPTDPWNFVSLLVFDAFSPDDPVTWWGSLQAVLQQYSNLYPVMDVFLDLSSYESVCANQELLRLAFGLDAANPNSMPVTRDLSPAKRAAILRWLDAPGPNGLPLLGTPPPPTATRAANLGLAADPAESSPSAESGGKVAALARRRTPIEEAGA
jgi:hypothetical protein